MNRREASRRISLVGRRHTMELLAVLLAGIGVGVGLGALVLGHGAPSTSHLAVSRAHTHPARTHGRLPAPATAGAQPGREAFDEPSGDATDPVLDADAQASFGRLESRLAGHLELTVAPLGAGAAETLGGDMPAHGWSTTKVPVLAALLEAREETLTSEERTWAESAITESSNQAVLDLFHDLERLEGGLAGASSYVQDLLRKSGDQATVVATAAPPAGAATTFGQTEWTPSNAVKFFSALARGCLLARAGTDYILGLMQNIEPSESWGLGAAGFASVAFKGGWGPEPSGAYLVRQAGIVDVGSPSAAAVAIVAFSPAGPDSFEAGTRMVTEGATWLREHLRMAPRTSVECA